jgi:hypothetical protein
MRHLGHMVGRPRPDLGLAPALEATPRSTDTNPVIARAATPFRLPGTDVQLAKLADCDESLSLVASDVRELVDELAVLRAGADDLVERHAEQSALLAEKELALATLESERSRACRRVDEISVALRETEDRLSMHEARTRSLQDELCELRDTLADRTRGLADAHAELERIREELVEHRDPVVRPGHDAEHWRQPSSPPGHALGPLPVNRDGHGAVASVAGHLRFGAFPDGYRLTASDERCSRPGDLIEIEGRRFLVTRVGRSPLPDDERPCAFLLPDTMPN